ncbi:putative protein phosphatase 2C 23 [Brachypodium distachyon]|uniref:Protein phosphatase n=1 Tax=Brachypodium distachyon TaxID=15368 RepID=I1IBV1_BRADI|nr:putative protein phosphatase 2C 23 [Brachypodium distachyon]KQK00458.1 hypothetical protein BRADI_3g49550v3 [Brachypodium distachyon]|eukprot:XP_003572738.1 putative protein phosphatase 2C 23 [Brachypodium distachyon]
METLEPIQQTLREIDKRVPYSLRAAFGLAHRPVALPSDDGDIASFVASFFQPQDDGPGPAETRGNDEEEEPRARAGLRMDWACYARDHDEDAHFGHGEAGVVGVADGVGGYRKRGVDAGAFSRGLMTAAFAEVCAAEPGTPVCPHTLLERAYEDTAASGAPGGSTAVILSLAPGGTDNTLRWAFIGDSAFAVFRGGRIVHRSRRQQKRFNHPLQLSAREGGVAKADVGEMAVREGDVVVVGTDGLFDNVFDGEIGVVVRMGTALGFSPKNMADVVAGVAYEMSRSNERDSPYSIDSRKHRGDRRHGGKPDDITVVVAFIVSAYS